MATITVTGTQATVTLVERERADGETEYELTCSSGAWCPQYEDLINWKSINLTDSVCEAERHADCIVHSSGIIK
jgi:hypothetical protein